MTVLRLEIVRARFITELFDFEAIELFPMRHVVSIAVRTASAGAQDHLRSFQAMNMGAE
jgi:hypothetical protein